MMRLAGDLKRESTALRLRWALIAPCCPLVPSRARTWRPGEARNTKESGEKQFVPPPTKDEQHEDPSDKEPIGGGFGNLSRLNRAKYTLGLRSGPENHDGELR